MSNLVFSFAGESKSETKFVGNSRNFQITIDEPPALGGRDEAANPVEYTLASLAGCLNVVAHVVAKELNIVIRSLKINIDGELNPNRFLAGDDTYRAGFSHINVKLDVRSNADKDLLAKWLDAVEERCPVTDNLVSPTTVRIVA
jgi:uncharacterized OsmC-like protein